jgi:hypothetical protein
MNIESSTCAMLTITEAPGLDQIDVFIVNYEPGKGRMVIRIWDRAWTCAWFAMGGKTIEQFFVECDWDYIHSNLTGGLHGMRKDAAKRDEDYLRRIIEAVQQALRTRAAGKDSGGGNA